MEEERLKVIVK